MTFPIVFHVIFQKTNMNEMDIDESYLNEIDNEVKVEISSDNDMQIMCEECSEVIEDNDKLNKIDKAHEG